ncbi:hypothetical protein N7456_002537 [Penicillium angulare]|uniref:BZIP domain-containing protein n=1 Tax=Penicillium angulare TaxID=116970 RepID=A0A9W9G8V5_9EURO|nr:hypothetical protein N7456_002537 [Penicillium angulare]
MAAEQKSESPSSSEDSPPQKQDPLERRRLQNRLSQRNHRKSIFQFSLSLSTKARNANKHCAPGRKIRDRIAKLQERVIANELRAAAALNGWDQPYSSQPISTQHSHFTPYKESDLTFGSPEHSPLSTEPSTPFIPSYPFSSHAITSTETNISHAGVLSGEPSYFLDSATCSSSPYSPPSNRHGVPLIVGNNPDVEPFQDPWSLGSGMVGNTSLPETGTSGCTNQNVFYVATGTLDRVFHFKIWHTNAVREPENALPHIIQALKSTPSTSKIIVVLPPTSINPHQTGTMGCNSLQAPHTTGHTNILSSSCSGIENSPQAAPGIFNIPCQCLHNTHSYSALNTISQSSRGWENVSPSGSGSGSYMISCPVHQKSLAPSETLANMCL